MEDGLILVGAHGKGTSADHAFWERGHNTALLQIAAFKSVVDTIEHVQSTRPKAYAQEPTYNMLDTSLLSRLGFMRVDSPRGWALLDQAYFAYCSPGEHFVTSMAIERDPVLLLVGHNIDGVRDFEAAHLRMHPVDHRWITKQEQQAKVRTIEKFMAEHDSYKLPAHNDPNAETHAFQEHVLYWRPLDDSEAHEFDTTWDGIPRPGDGRPNTGPCRHVMYSVDSAEDGTPIYRDKNLPAAADMTHEQLMENFKNIESRLKASGWWRDFTRSLREALAQIDIKIETCICFATGTMSGYHVHAEWTDPEGTRMGHDIALYQLAAFKGAVDIIEEVQKCRPLAYAQEPEYNDDFDGLLLQQLRIEKVDSALDCGLITSNSFTSNFGWWSNEVLAKGAALSLDADLERCRKSFQERSNELFSLTSVSGSDPNYWLQEVQATDAFLENHNAWSLEESETIFDFKGWSINPFRLMPLYAVKPRRQDVPHQLPKPAEGLAQDALAEACLYTAKREVEHTRICDSV